MKKLVLLNLALMLFIQISRSQAIPDSALYFGLTPPGDTPVRFTPEIFNQSAVKPFIITFSPDGTQVFYDKRAWPQRVVMHLKYENGNWTGPDTASFSINQWPGEPSFSPDGQHVYYYAFPNLSNTNNTNIYTSEYQDSVWGNPATLGGSMVTSGVAEYHPCAINDSSVYFTNGSGNICKSQYKDGVYQDQKGLPYPVNYANTSQVYADAYIAPDESYLIFRSNRIGGLGQFDLYISYKKSDGSWTNPKNLGNKINTASDEGEGDITPDGKYMTFDRINDLYWVSTSFIDSLKHTNFAPYYVPKKISNQTDTVELPFSYTIPDSAFIDDDGINTLSYSATLSDGSDLPAWLSFDTTTLTFSGTPVVVENYSIKVIATDTAGSASSAVVLISVKNGATALDEMSSFGIQFYPNPVQDILNIDLGKLQGIETRLEICNMAGQVVYVQNIVANTSVDFTKFNKGCYLVKLSNSNGTISRTILLQ